MKKYVVLSLVLVLALMSSCAHAALSVTFIGSESYHVGDNGRLAGITVSGASGGTTIYSYTVAGELPPGSNLTSQGRNTASIEGGLTTAGTYNFTVNVQATVRVAGKPIEYYYGSCDCVMEVLPAENSNGNNNNNNNGTPNFNDFMNNNGNTNNNNGNTNNGNNTGNNGTTGGGGGGGCNSGMNVLCLAVLAAFTHKK